MAKVDKLSPEA